MSKTSYKKRAVAFLIPAHNEQKVIGSTIKSILRLVKAEDIYVVNDYSKDDTEKVVKKLTKNVLNLRSNIGKAKALNNGLQKFKLTQKYEFIMIIDADCRVDDKFLKEALPIFKKDKSDKIACLVGKVVGESHNWITSYRIWEYEVAQCIHKAAQSHINAMIVCPGPSTIYRSRVLEKIKIPTDTLTEDMDLTFLIHRERLGTIKYCGRAKVITQDPQTLKDFIRQIDRWYTGFWQCVKKHNAPWGGQPLDIEVGLLATEGLYNGILVIMILLLLPFLLIKNPALLFWPLLIDLGLFVIPTMVLAAGQRKAPGIFRYILPFYLIRIITSMVFLKSFFKVVVGIDLNMSWNKAARYSFDRRNNSSKSFIYNPVLRFINRLPKGKEDKWANISPR